MKIITKNLFFLPFCLLMSFSLSAQIEVTPQAGYQVGSKYSYYDGYMKLKSSGHFGVTVDFDVNPIGAQVELIYAFQNADLNFKDYYFFPYETYITQFNVHHIQAGFIQNFNYDESFRPFAGISAGVVVFDPQYNKNNGGIPDYDPGNRTKFEFGFTGGAKYFFTDRIGVRLQAQLLVPLEWGGIYYGSGGGGIYTSGGTLLQLNFTGGLIFRLGD